MFAQLRRLSRFWVTEIDSSVLPFERRRVEDVCAGMLERRKRWRLGGDFREDMEVLGELEGAGLKRR